MGGVDDVGHHHAFGVAVQAQAHQQVTLALAQGFQGGRDGKAAHQLGDVVHIVGVRGDIAGAAGARRAHRLEQDGLAGGQVAGGGVFFAVPGKQPVAGAVAGDAGHAHNQGVRGVGVAVLQLGVAVDVNHIRRADGAQPVVHGGAGPAAVAIHLVQKAGDGATAALELDIHRRARKFIHQLGRHRPAVVHGQNQRIAVGGDGGAGVGVAHVGQHPATEVGDDAAVLDAGDQGGAQGRGHGGYPG